MRKAEYKQIEKTEEYAVIIPAKYDEEGNVIAEEHTEIRTRTVPILEMVYRDMTPEEEAEYNNSIPNIPQEPTQEDRIEAQVLYTALMTDTLLEG